MRSLDQGQNPFMQWPPAWVDTMIARGMTASSMGSGPFHAGPFFVTDLDQFIRK